MKEISLTLFLEISNLNYSFFVGKSDELNNFKIIHKSILPLNGIENNGISNFEKVYDTIKENVYIAEQKLSHTFKEIVLILDNFNPTFVNLSKK